LEVGKLGLSPAKFSQTARKSQQYVLFIYFFDRIDPETACSVGFSNTAKRWDSGSMSDKYYAAPGSWPVIAEKVSIEDKLASNLYLNVFFKKSLMYHCIASHKML
jgi:hypothetical protein